MSNFTPVNQEEIMKRVFNLLILTLVCALAYTQPGMTNPVKVTIERRAVSGQPDFIDLVFSFAIDEGWHVYGPENNGGPIAMTFNAETLEGCKKEGALKLSPAPKRVQDPLFECEVTFVEKSAKATQHGSMRRKKA